jgi:hypothetical protein
MEADATNVTPKILMEEIKDYNWTVDEILAGAPPYEKKKEADKKNLGLLENIEESFSCKVMKLERPGTWITDLDIN